MFNEQLLIVQFNSFYEYLILTFVAEKRQGVRIVDKLLVEFGSRKPPLSLNVADTEVKRIKFEMRLINKVKSIS